MKIKKVTNAPEFFKVVDQSRPHQHRRGGLNF